MITHTHMDHPPVPMEQIVGPLRDQPPQLTYDKSPVADLLDMGSETLEIGLNALNDLESQNAKLARATDQLDEIHHDLKVADKKLDTMENFWTWLGGCIMPASTTQFKAQSTPQTFNQVLLPPIPTTKFESHKSGVPLSPDAYIATQDADLDRLLEQTQQMRMVATNIGESLDASVGLIDRATNLTAKATVKEKQMIEKEKKLMS